LATGGRPPQCRAPGADLAGVVPLRTIEQADEMVNGLKLAQHAVWVGAGSITLGHIQTRHHLGIATTVILRVPFYWGSILDHESGQLISSILEAAPMVRVMYQTEVAEVVGDDHVKSVILSDGQRVAADVVLVNIGIELNVGWLKDSGLRLQGGII